MTHLQYKLLLKLYHNYNAAFISLDSKIQDAYYDILFGRKGYIPSPTPHQPS